MVLPDTYPFRFRIRWGRAEDVRTTAFHSSLFSAFYIKLPRMITQCRRGNKLSYLNKQTTDIMKITKRLHRYLLVNLHQKFPTLFAHVPIGSLGGKLCTFFLQNGVQ